MTKRRNRRTADTEETKENLFARLPLWVSVLLFILPLLASEFMFHRVDRRLSMILFPIAWVGFWIAMMERSGWPILKRGKDEGEEG